MPRTPAQSPSQKTLITTSKHDQVYLHQTIADLSVLDEKTSKSELFALGLALLRERSPKEIQQLLHRERARVRA